MTEEQEEKELELEIALPKIIQGPIQLDDGATINIGDRVKHLTFGEGNVVRLSFSERLGNLVYVDFDSGKDEIVGASFVKKL